jgi:arginyl-tRNA synthetase
MQTILSTAVRNAVNSLFGLEINATDVQISPTRKEFEGDLTVVCFPYTKAAKLKPQDIGEAIGRYIVAHCAEVSHYNVVQGFLNISFSDAFWNDFLKKQVLPNPTFGESPKTGKRILIEFSSPNTNKPLHLGHIRNILLGWSTHNLLKANGNDVVTCKVVNDRGVHICKSMLAWQRFGNGETPTTNGIKGDHLVGKYYVQFEKAFQAEYAAWQLTDAAHEIWTTNPKSKADDSDTARYEFFKSFYKNHYFNEISELGTSCKKMLQDWEANDKAVRELWATMNGWVYAGFDTTYERLGVAFDFRDYESQTYLLGKEIIEKGLENNIFYRRDDSSVWIDLTDAKLDEKLVLRSDGTSVYITQDIGTANTRNEKYNFQGMIYVVADEQDYHFKVLFEILKRLGEPYADGLHHLSYGMVNLPEGRMKSREGTVVDADDLMDEVIAEAKEQSGERGELQGLSAAEQHAIHRSLGMSALKYHILKVSPQKSMVFDPRESVDMQGQTGPYIQNAFVKTKSVERKAAIEGIDISSSDTTGYTILPAEKDILQILQNYPNTISMAARDYNPADICTYAFLLAKAYHRFWHEHKILGIDDDAARNFRILLSKAVGQVLVHSMAILGIEMPERM